MDEPSEHAPAAAEPPSVHTTSTAESLAQPARGALDQAWENVQAEWEDDEAHRRFIGLATTLDALPDAGRRYRAVQETDPERSERAKASMEKIFSVALGRMELTRSPERRPPRTLLFLVALSLSVGLVGAALWAYLGG